MAAAIAAFAAALARREVLPFLETDPPSPELEGEPEALPFLGIVERV